MVRTRKAQENPYAEVGRRVRETRTRMHITQAQLADASGVSRETISALERGTDKKYLPITIVPLWHTLGLGDAELQVILTGSHSASGDSRIEELRRHVAEAPIGQRMRDTILALIDSDLT